MVHSFIEAFNDGSKQIAKNNALSELKSRCQSMQFVAHFHALPAPVFSPVLDIVSTLCVDSNDHDSLRDDLVALLFDVVGGAACVGYPTPPFAKALSTLVHSVVHAIVEIGDVDLDASFALHLQTLAACLRGNVGVRLFVSELPTRKELVRTLALLLNRTDDASILIHAMSVLACLVLQEPMGRKLFQPKNVAHALTLVLSIVDNNPGTAHASSMLMTTRLDSSACSRWHIDTLITMLSIAGSILPDEHISSSLIVLIQKNPALHVYVVHKLFWALHEDTAQLALAHVALWCIGEYGHALCASDPPADEETLQGKTRVDEAVVVALITTVRCLLEPQWASIRGDILAPMPLIDMTRVRTRQSQLLAFSAPATSADFDDMPTTASSAPEAPPAPTNLLDLDDIFGTTTPAAASTSAPPAAAAAAAPTIDLLADLFSPAPATTNSSAPPAVVPSSASSQLLDIFGGPPPAPIATAVQPPGQHIRVYEKNGLTLDIDLSKPNSSDPSISHILCLFTNASAYQLDNFVFQAAFPKVVVDLFAPALAIQKDYSNTFTLLRAQSTYAISLLYTRRTDLETIIPILRSPMASPESLLTQYCWLDFNKTWETAHTDSRCRD
ncbi:hypothetical protein DYB30_001610 [Aphanomyces astaci]|uniref:GAE domain-containing protein n=3 Tax=Aphanomyces astaci TaxID=112090 RepID=A0A397E3R0_APHAT|nr:hypothetical protein DYB30_001610 [Aphanomyces astaci]